MKRQIAYILSVILIAVCMSPVAFAAAFTPTGSVADINTISIGNSAELSADLTTAGISNQKVFDITFSNNHHEGYIITLASGNSGQLRSTSLYESDEPGTYLEYTVTVPASNNGTLGADLTAQGLTTVSLSSDQTLNYSNGTDDPGTATVSAVQDVKITTSEDSTIFQADDFEDAITVTIADDTQ